MDIPGLSIFQGGGSIQINTSANQLEEQEALEDQKRRNEELENELQNAFDDLSEDEDYTINSTSNIKSHYNRDEDECVGGPFNKESLQENNEKQNLLTNDNYGFDNKKDKKMQGYIDEIQHLTNVIESKNNELETISKLLHDEKKKTEELNKRLALSEAEKCRAQMAKQQTHELLVESKAKFSELEDSTSKLKAKIKTLEDCNIKLEQDLERTRLMLSEVQQKYHMVEKNAGFNADRRVDILMKQTNDRHKAQTEILQQQLDNIRGKLEDKERELNALDVRYKELQRNREAILIDKSETINQLAKSLEESQQQCQKLMTKKDFAQENVALKRVIEALEQQSDHQQKTIMDLRSRLDATSAELAILDSVLHENMDSDNNSPKRINFAKQNLAESTPLTTNDRLDKLKNELYRSMASQKAKREEIKKLQTEIESKNLEIKHLHTEIDNKNKEIKDLGKELHYKDEDIKSLKEEENKCLVLIATLKEEKIRFENRIIILENELDQANKRKSDTRKSTSLEIENARSQGEQNTFENENQKIKHIRKSPPKTDENKFHILDIQLKNLNIDLEELKQEHESLKNNYEAILKENKDLKDCKKIDSLMLELEKQKFLLEDAQKECNRVKNLYIEVCNDKEQILMELDQLKSKDIFKDLREEEEKSTNLQRALQLAEMKSSELTKLLEIEKSNRENEVKDLKEKIRKEKTESSKSNNAALNCSKCLHYTADITKLEISNIKLENQCAIYRKQVNDLREQLSQSEKCITELREKLELKEEQEKIISDLKEKAHQFEEYIETCRSSNAHNCSPRETGSNSTSGISSPKPTTTAQTTSRNQNIETSPEFQNKLRREIESTIRDDMAKIFAKEIKSIEEHFNSRIKELEDLNMSLKKNLQKLNHELTSRQNEVQLLKYTVIAEREKFDEITNTKDIQNEKNLQKYKDILQKCREELKSKQDRIKELIKELDERNFQIENERQSMKAVMKQWEESRSLSDKKELEMLKCIDEMKQEHSKIIESWKAKYESAKRTANNYKLYSEEKEQHLMKEYERMKTEFELARTKLKNKFHDCVEKTSLNKNLS
ncbi:repetitive organellar protein [Condylostylus longicornis]|uniref:repetitive organellar protein n=1 Tax=Condylostylus longicornis TaxID=2530218 RepID=UPI00244E1A55|nr:repetitive organellar protein [Condylostylus longicornis]